ncbi:MAG: recombination mediator RecR [Paludibacteraceae bacterium]|nr:recombination mediator RecR [Paludibacteraceae bacterium]
MIQELPSQILENAVQSLASLPGVGRKTALKYALFLLKQDNKTSNQFIDNINNLISNIQYCTKCHNISDKPICEICNNSKRDHHTICVVETIKEVMLIENTAQYDGVYHVLGGLISPINGISPSDLEISSLIDRVQKEEIEEIILALSPNVEGDTTCFYLYRKLADFNIKITTIARGVAIGDNLEYADEITLGRSIKNRINYHS